MALDDRVQGGDAIVNPGDSHEFDAAAAGMPELDSMGLMELISKLFGELVSYTDIATPNYNAWERGPLAVARTAIRQVPFLVGDLTSGSYTRTDAIDQHADKVRNVLMELGERVDERGDHQLADRIALYVSQFPRYSDETEGRAILSESVKLVTEEFSPDVAGYAKLLGAMWASDHPRSNDDLAQVAKGVKAKIERAKGAGKRLDESDLTGEGVLTRLSNKLGGLTKLEPVAVALGMAAVLAITGYSVIGDEIQKKYNYDTLHPTDYSVALHDLPQGGEGFSQIPRTVIDAGNFAALCDTGAVAASVGTPLDFTALKNQLKEKVNIARSDVKSEIDWLRSPEFSSMLQIVLDGGNIVRSSIEHTHHSEYYTVCVPVVVSDGKHTSVTIRCHDVFDWRDDFWKVDHAKGSLGHGKVVTGLFSMPAHTGKPALAQLNVPQIATGQYPNLGNTCMEAYISSVSGLYALPTILSQFTNSWNTVPTDHTSRTRDCDCQQQWGPEDLVNDIGNQTNRVGRFQAVTERLEAYSKALDTLQLRLQNYDDVALPRLFERTIRDSSTDIIIALGYPRGQGHLYQSEMEGIVKTWRYALGGLGIFIAAAGLGMYEHGLAARRRESYSR